MNSADSILAELRRLADPGRVEGMAKFAVGGKNTLGVSMPAIRGVARGVKRNHALAKALWASGIHEARILASMVAEPSKLTAREMNQWVKDFDSWDVCDQICLNLFCETPRAFARAIAWSSARREFEKRAGFALMACLAVHAKKESDERFFPFLAAIEREATDSRNFVKKAVNWALRQIGKRNKQLNAKAIVIARALQKSESSAARWVANDALRELKSDRVKTNLKNS